MEKLTVIIPTYNEAHNISALLKQVDFADEVIVIDSHSTDQTIELAENFHVKIIRRRFDNYSNQKNHAISMAKNEWILLIDADERISQELKEEVMEVLGSNTKKTGFWIYRKNFFMDRELRFSGIKNDKVLRLFKKSTSKYNGKPVHEEIDTEGETGFLKNRFEHYSYYTLELYIRKITKYAKLQSAGYAKKTSWLSPYHFVVKPLFRFCKHYLFGLGILDGYPGLIYASLQMYAVFARYVYVWQHKHRRFENDKPV